MQMVAGASWPLQMRCCGNVASLAARYLVAQRSGGPSPQRPGLLSRPFPGVPLCLRIRFNALDAKTNPDHGTDWS